MNPENEQQMNALGSRLREAMNRYLSRADSAVVPRLGAGMTISTDFDGGFEYDPKADVLTVTGTVRIKLYREERPDWVIQPEPPES